MVFEYSGFSCSDGDSIYSAYKYQTAGANTTWAPMIAIYWASSDLSILETNPLKAVGTTAAPLTATATATAPTTATATVTNTQLVEDHDGLAPGAIAGIAIGGFLLGVLITGWAVWVFIKRRRVAAQEQQQQQEGDSEKSGAVEMSAVGPTTSSSTTTQAATPSNVHVVELAGQHESTVDSSAELPDHMANNHPTGNVPVEIPAAEVMRASSGGGLTEGPPWSQTIF